MGQGRPINRDDWPSDGPHLRLLEFLDGIHRARGLRSRGEITAAMDLTSRTNVNAILRGHRLPADERQARDLARALGGDEPAAQRAAALYAEARASTARPRRSSVLLWADRVRAHEAWDRAPDASARTSAVAMAGHLAGLADAAAAELTDDPWLDPDLGLRFTAAVESLLRGPLRELDGLSPAETTLLALVPLLHQTHALRALARLRALEPASLAPAESPSAERRAFEVFLREHPELAARARAPQLPDRKNASGEIGWWLLHRWLARHPRLHNLPEIRPLLEPDGLADAETVQKLLYALRLDVSELTAGDRAKALRRESRTSVGEQIVREQLVAHVLAVAAGMALDPTRLPDVVVRHLGIPGALDLAALRANVAGRVRWLPGDDLLVLSARCEHPAELEGLRGYAARMDGLLHAVRRAARENPHLAPLAALPSRATADEVTAGTDEDGRPLFQGVSRFRLDERRVQELLMGEQLYQDRSLAVRELYQNALDACRYREARVAHLSGRGLWLDDWTGRIAFRQGTDGNGRAFIECADNGIGMTETVLTEVFAQAGTRFTDMPDFLDEAAEWEAADPPVPFFPNSRFGIGVLSYFMLADEIEITTRPMGRRGDPQPTLKVSIFGPGHLFRIDHVPLERSPGTTVRLYLRPGERSVDCMDVLKEWLRIAQFHTTVTVDGRLRGNWRAGVLGGSGEGEEDVLASWAEPGGATVTWVRSQGAVLVDGLMMRPSRAGRPDFDVHDPARDPNGVVVNLTGPRTPARISVDRRNVLSDVSADVEELITRAAPSLVGPGAPPLGADWLFSLTHSSRRIADIVIAATIAAGGRIEHAAGVWDTARTGCFILDAQLTWGSRRHAPWDCFGGRPRPVVGAFDQLDDLPDAIVLWRILAHGLAGEFGLPGLDDAPDVLPALPSDAIVLRGRAGGYWQRRAVSEPERWLREVAAEAEMPPEDVVERLRKLGVPERTRDHTTPASPAPWDDSTLVLSTDPRKAAALIAAALAYGDDLDGLGPDQIATLSGRVWTRTSDRPRNKADAAFFTGWRDLPVLLRIGPASLFAQAVLADCFGTGPDRVRTVLRWTGFDPGPPADIADLAERATAIWPSIRRDGEVRPAGLCRAANEIAASPAELGEFVAASGVPVPFNLPDEVEEPDLRLLEVYAEADPVPSPGRPLDLALVVHAAERAGTPVDTAVRRLVAYGYPPLPDGLPGGLDGITRHMIAQGVFLGDLPSRSPTTVTMADLIRIQAEQGAEFTETAARLARCGFAVPDLAAWTPEAQDILLLRTGASAAGRWIARNRPVGLLHLVRAAWETRRTVPDVAARLRELGMDVPDLDQTIRTALERVPRAPGRS